MPGRVRHLVLLRHAQAEHTGVSDELRRLTGTGRRQAGAVGASLAAAGLVPDTVLVSSSVRTRETWDLVAQSLGDEPEPEVVVSDALYRARADDVLDLVHGVDGRSRTLLVVGHEPAMSATAAWLAGGGSSTHLAQVQTGLPTGGYAVLELDTPWPELARLGAALRDVARPAWQD